ncbi:MAG: diguanylate cyclase [Aridibacter sp.]
MKSLNTSSHNLKTKIFGGVIMVLALIAVGFSVFESFSYSFKDWTIFGVTAAICIIFTQYRAKISNSAGYLLVREPAIFFGIITLGIGGGVLVALFGVLGNFRRGVKSKIRWFMEMSVITLTTFASASGFYFLTKYVFDVPFYPVAENQINLIGLAGALAISGFAHYFLYTFIYSIFFTLKGSSAVLRIWKDNFLRVAAIYASCIISVFGFYLLTNYFGLLFGLVILPLIVVGHLAYRFHQQTLAQNTKEILETSRIHLATVEALATAIDARDQLGHGQITRTQTYALGIGKILNLSNDELKALKIGTLLKDIGKLAVPEHILNKSGKLTPAEMEKAKIHPTVGALILEKVNFPYPVVPTIKYHHEMWDGTGYPNGLEKEEIPITARILAVADTYDTLRSSRPYRAAVSRENARKFLINGAGTQFDPKIVDVLLRNLLSLEEEIENQGLAYVEDYDENDEQQHTSQNPGEEYIEQIKLANREVFTLYELARVFSSSLNLEETYSLFVRKISELVSLDTCVIYLLDDSKTFATAKYITGKNRNAILGKKIEPGQGATGYVLQKRQPVHNVNPGLDFSFDKIECLQNYSAMASIPLVAGETLLGAVSIYSCQLNSYEDEQMRILESISRIASDAIAQSLQHAETESKALTDPMTSLPNARSLELQFEKEIARARRNGTSLQVLMLDLDGFKSINDTFGHKAGDTMLKEVSRVMRKELRDYDFLARYAGDEFVAIVPETDRKAVIELCQRMEKAFRSHQLDVGNGRFAGVGVSLGAAAFPNSGETLDEILIAADKAMYAVKEKRKEFNKKKNQKAIESRRRLQKIISEDPLPIKEVSAERDRVRKDNKFDTEETKEQTLIVELDESHIISTNSVN